MSEFNTFPTRLDMSGLNKIFAGNLLVILDFRINGLDILPDIIGFIIMYVGLLQLSYYKEEYKRGKLFAILMAFLSLFDLYQVNQPLNSITPGFLLYTIILGGITTFVSLMLVYYILTGTAKIANDCNELALEELCYSRFKLLMVIRIISIVGSYLSLLFGGGAALFIIVFVVISFIAEIMYMMLLKQSYNLLHLREIDNSVV